VALGWPLRYSHSPGEVIDTKDLDALSKIVEVLAWKWRNQPFQRMSAKRTQSLILVVDSATGLRTQSKTKLQSFVF
jgi:hypothetical protein